MDINYHSSVDLVYMSQVSCYLSTNGGLTLSGGQRQSRTSDCTRIHGQWKLRGKSLLCGVIRINPALSRAIGTTAVPLLEYTQPCREKGGIVKESLDQDILNSKAVGKALI